MEVPEGLWYTSDDEWLRLEGAEAVVGITDYAQDQLGDVVYVELPAIGRDIEGGAPFGVIESVKAVSDLNAPVSGRVIARNDALEASPELVNQSPYGEGWLLRVQLVDAATVERLLTPEAYRAQLPDEPAE